MRVGTYHTVIVLDKRKVHKKDLTFNTISHVY